MSIEAEFALAPLFTYSVGFSTSHLYCVCICHDDGEVGGGLPPWRQVIVLAVMALQLWSTVE